VDDRADPLSLATLTGRWRGAAPDMPERIAAVAAGLAADGIGRGDAVAWQLPNCVEAVALYGACWQVGAVAVPLHHLAGPAEVERMLARIAPALVVGRPDDVPGAATGRPTTPAPGGADPRPGPGPGHPPGPEDVAVVLHTSGSSGEPKGVRHTHAALAGKARLMAEVHGLGPDDVVLMPAPLAHVSGLLNGILVPAAAGMRTVLMARWSPEEALDLIEAERVSFMVGPPTFFVGLERAEGFAAERVASLRLLSVGGAGVTPEFVERTSEVFGAVVKRSYGSTEAPTITTATAGDDAVTRARTDGRPVGAARVRIVDPSADPTSASLPVGEPGEIQVTGPELFAGYTDHERTAEVMVRVVRGAEAGDWFRTGDLGVLDARGRLTVTGRLKDVIIRGGENIDPAEVGAHIEAHPAVRHAAVVGVPDERLGERVCAFVEAPDGGFDLEECRRWFEQRGVARFRTPERVVVLEEIPLLASGKADRAALARWAALDAPPVGGRADNDGPST
jgi:acyl-CoA synthetase (AMP-forming)/AMP-acid ligase II